MEVLVGDNVDSLSSLVLIGLFLLIAGTLVSVFLIVDIISGRRHYNEAIVVCILDQLDQIGVHESSLKEDSKMRLKKIENSKGGLSNELDIRNNYRSILEYASSNLMTPVDPGWEAWMWEANDEHKKAIKEEFESVLEGGQNKSKELVDIAYEKYKSNSALRWNYAIRGMLGPQFRTKVVGKLLGSILGWAGTGGTLGLFAGLMFSLSEGRLMGWQVSVFPMVGTVVGGYLRSVFFFMLRYRDMPIWRQTKMYCVSVTFIAVVWFVLSVLLLGFWKNPLTIVASLMVLILLGVAFYRLGNDKSRNNGGS